MNYKGIVDHLLQAPDSQLDASMFPLIKAWGDPPTPLQVLEVLDKCIFSALASGFVVTLLQIMFDELCKSNNTSLDEVVKGAVWRKEGNW